MYAFSSSIDVPAGVPLAGFGDRIHEKTCTPGALELHGIGVADEWELCSLDTLYAGTLATQQASVGMRRVCVASHTHFAPMLDPGKPAVGQYSPETVAAFSQALTQAPRRTVEPDTCRVYRAEVDLPVYRRFDFPSTALNRLLARRAGFYPNDAHPVDRSVYVLVFSAGDKNLFGFVYHANHPVTRASGAIVSADYVQALRDGVMQRFGMRQCLFLLGCAGDIRPNIATRRTRWLPRSRFNWRFRYGLTLADQEAVDQTYRRAVAEAACVETFPVSGLDFRLTSRAVNVRGVGQVEVPRLDIGSRASFVFLPFEVSHRYHLEIDRSSDLPRRFIVSCAGDTRGYLPHGEQLDAGGYEVDGSRPLMGIPARPSLRSEDLW